MDKSDIVPDKEFDIAEDCFEEILERSDLSIPLLGRATLKDRETQTIRVGANMSKASKHEYADYIKAIDWEGEDKTNRSALGYLCFDKDAGEAFMVYRLTQDYYQKVKERKKKLKKERKEESWK